jgi:L-aspartate oxidase
MKKGFDAILTADLVIVGGGVAGLSAALHAGPARVLLVSKTPFAAGGASVLAQGGVAAALGEGDSPELHARDTLAVAGGLGHPEAVEVLTREGPGRVLELAGLGVRFDRDAEGLLALGREAAHSRRRIVHAADATGAEMVRGLARAVAACPWVQVLERTFASSLVLAGGRVAGVSAWGQDGSRVLLAAPAVALATGGIGRLYRHTTNPPEATGDGLAMAARAGARLADLEFVQFHPTALEDGSDPMLLLTEALRGEGALVVDEGGRRFLFDFCPQGELAPRDQVSRALWQHRQAGHRTFLDATGLADRLESRFPTVFRSCLERGLDPRRQPLPVCPAAHYHMGGVAVDCRGRTSLPGLWACGEVAATGVHGANRLASNSLLEGLVFGARVGEDAALCRLPRPEVRALETPEEDPWEPADPSALAALRTLMWRQVGLVREEAGLLRALAELEALEPRLPRAGEAANLLRVARLLTLAALARPESRGAHYRQDCPQALPEWQGHLVVEGEKLRLSPRLAA